jgi:hypothetical protein
MYENNASPKKSHFLIPFDEPFVDKLMSIINFCFLEMQSIDSSHKMEYPNLLSLSMKVLSMCFEKSKLENHAMLKSKAMDPNVQVLRDSILAVVSFSKLQDPCIQSVAFGLLKNGFDVFYRSVKDKIDVFLFYLDRAIEHDSNIQELEILEFIIKELSQSQFFKSLFEWIRKHDGCTRIFDGIEKALILLKQEALCKISIAYISAKKPVYKKLIPLLLSFLSSLQTYMINLGNK